MAKFHKKIISFYQSVRPPGNLPKGIEALFPQQEAQVMDIVKRFYTRYFNDDEQRTLILGIHPGRFGAGVTGINFTAPKQLKEDCGIDHSLKMQSELSAEFIYRVIGRYGGPEQFYKHFFLGSLSPLGYIQNGKNINYYDDRDLQTAITPYIISTIKEHLSWNINPNTCICIGDGKNFRFLSKLNQEHAFFKEIIPLPHPRFILQYRRKSVEEYIEKYLKVLSAVSG